MLRKLFVICNLSFVIFLILPSPALAATLSLSPTAGTFGKSCSFAVTVSLDTQGVETDGSDIILLYDPTKITAQSIENGTIYNDFPGNTIDNSVGKASIYALAPTDQGFVGRGTVARVNFMTSATASASLASINFDFDPSNLSKTTDSNVIRRSDLKDVLGVVSNGSYTLDSNATGCKTVAKPTTPPSSTNSLPESGITDITSVVGGIGAFLTLIGVLGLTKRRWTMENRR